MAYCGAKKKVFQASSLKARDIIIDSNKNNKITARKLNTFVEHNDVQ